MEPQTNCFIRLFIAVFSLVVVFGPFKSISVLNIEKSFPPAPPPTPTPTPTPTPPPPPSPQPTIFMQCPPCPCELIELPYFRRQCIIENQKRLLYPISPSVLTVPTIAEPSFPSLDPLHLLPSPYPSPPSAARWKLCLFILLVMGFFSEHVRDILLKFPNCGERLKVLITLTLTLVFHGLFSVYGEPTENFIVFVSASCLIMSILKLLQPNDATNLTEDLGISFLKIGLECLIREKGNGILRALVCLVPFSICMFAKFSGAIDVFFSENFINWVVWFKGEVRPYVDNSAGWIKKMTGAFADKVQAAWKKK